LNVEAYYYSYPDYNPHDGPKASYFEAQGYLSHTFDKLTVTVMGAYSPKWSLAGGEGWYTAGTLSYAITDWLSASGTVGHQWVALAPSDYTHYAIGLTAIYKSFTVDVRYVGNHIGKTNCGFWMATPNAWGDTVKANITFNVADLFK
jgi:hypothetical protein